MYLAEALLEKKNLNSSIEELQGRYTTAAVIEEGTTPDEAAEEILRFLEAAFQRWENLTVAVNLTNNQIMVGDKTMMEAIVRRDSLKSQILHFSGILGSLRQRNNFRRYDAGNPKMIVVEGVHTKHFIKLVDDLSKQLRELDTSIQAANWSNQLIINKCTGEKAI